MKEILPLFVFIDACGWEIIRDEPFARDFAPQRQRLTSVFGYSSACVPSILSGRWPVEHRHWCYFVYDPVRSPFKLLRPLRWLPRALTSRRRFRHQLSRLLKVPLRFRGYFDLYNIPFEHIGLFDFTEKRNPLQAGGMNRGPNIFDHLEQHRIPYHVSDPTRTELENFHAVSAALRAEQPDFAFVYWPGLDGLLHQVGNQSPQIAPKLRHYEHWLHRLLETAHRHYRQTHLYIFSDHGMANCDHHVDLRTEIDQLGLVMGRDYVVVYDSTMARFWFFHPTAKDRISAALARIETGRILPDGELAQLGALFPDRYFGELIFLMEEGTLIVPSHMGERPIRAMHGYHPDAPQSYAALCTNQPAIPERIRAIPDIYRLMLQEAQTVTPRRPFVSNLSQSPPSHRVTSR